MKTEDSKPDTLHEIKSHLTIVRGYLQLIDSSVESEHKSKEWISKIINEIDTLLDKLQYLKNK